MRHIENITGSTCLAKFTQRLLSIIVTVGLTAGNQHVVAEEGGSGHYFPGSMASFVDGVSPVDALLVRLNVIDYSGSVISGRSIPIAGSEVLDVDIDSQALGFTGFWRPSWGQISEKWSYGMSGTVPFVDLKLSGVVTDTARQRQIKRSESVSGLGDVLLLPLMFNYAHSPDLNINMRLGVYLPTGDYEVGRLANEGKNFTSYEPTIAAIYFSQTTGWEATAFLGMTLNEKNDDTDYKSGNQAHFESTVARHFPVGGGSLGLGLTGYVYRQVTGDSGSGAVLGDFKARANGIGPVVSWVSAVGGHRFMSEFKWMNEFDVKNRPEGDILFLKMMLYL